MFYYWFVVVEGKQNIENLEGSSEDGFTKLTFSRKRNTGDKQDIAFTDDEGMYMIFPVRGGKFNGVNKRIKKHERTPIASSEKIFIRSCRGSKGMTQTKISVLFNGSTTKVPYTLNLCGYIVFVN